MEVAAFHPLAPALACEYCATKDSSLWPSSSRRRARTLSCIPLCGARTFLCVLHSGCLADSRGGFYRAARGLVPAERPEVPRVFVIDRVVICGIPPGIAEDGQRREQAGVGIGSKAP